MKRLTSILLIGFLAVGCKWTPQRDNPVDPLSQFYVAPPPPPQIDTTFMTTHCYYDAQTSYCTFEIVCKVNDPYNNIVYDSVESFITRCYKTPIDVVHLGYLSFDPLRDVFFLEMDEHNAPGSTLDSLVGCALFVKVADIAGATDGDSIIFQAPLQARPQILEPRDYTTTGPHPNLHWSFWIGVGPHTFSVQVKRNESDIWSASGIASTDTSIQVSDSLDDSAAADILYSWRLTVTNSQQNGITSPPAFFFVSHTAGIRKDPTDELQP
jgi:hypothetical protein